MKLSAGPPPAGLVEADDQIPGIRRRFALEGDREGGVTTEEIPFKEHHVDAAHAPVDFIGAFTIEALPAQAGDDAPLKAPAFGRVCSSGQHSSGVCLRSLTVRPFRSGENFQSTSRKYWRIGSPFFLVRLIVSATFHRNQSPDW
jgi:hypothetical protein